MHGLVVQQFGWKSVAPTTSSVTRTDRKLQESTRTLIASDGMIRLRHDGFGEAEWDHQRLEEDRSKRHDSPPP
jgi:hypothetical protein